MTRDEALTRLHGTWAFDLRDGRVRVRDLALLRAIDAPGDDDRADRRPPHDRPAHA